jgi:hypothetical protein
MREDVVMVAMIHLDYIWNRWPISFTISPSNTDGVIEINAIDKGKTLGRAYSGARNLRGPWFGVFSKGIMSKQNLTIAQEGKLLALVISHEVGHTYTLKHVDSDTIMNAIIPWSRPMVFDPEQVKYLDEVLGMK